MKTLKTLCLFFVLVAIPLVGNAQTIGVVDLEFIMNEMPEMVQAKQQMEDLEKEFQQAIMDEQMAMQIIQDQYMSDISDAKREELEQKLFAIQEKFMFLEQTYEMDMQVLTEKVEKPLIEKIKAACEEVRAENSMDVILDISSNEGLAVLAYNDSKDVTEAVCKKLGIKLK